MSKNLQRTLDQLSDSNRLLTEKSITKNKKGGASLIQFLSNKNPNTPTNSISTSLFQRERLQFILQYAFAYVEEEKGLEIDPKNVEELRDKYDNNLEYNSIELKNFDNDE